MITVNRRRHNHKMERENFKSRIGFLLVSAGCAIGIGNVWKFPYVTGQNGGGLFVILYLLFLIIMGLPVLTMELAIGRGGRKSTIPAYKKLEPKGSWWHLHGWVCELGCLILMMYYTTVSGWMLNYAVKFITGAFDHVSPDQAGAMFNSMLADPKQMIGFMFITIVIGIVVCSFGLQNGIEKITTVMMSGLLVLIIILAFHSVTLPNAAEGIKFYLLPNLERAKASGIGHAVMAAMNQAFFTLSIGIGSMEIFGSYMSDDNTLMGESVRICALDTFVAILSGLIIFPACFCYHVEPTAGPSLIFVALPQVFLNMKLGRVWGSLFFLFMTAASLSTVIAVFENLIAFAMDMFGWERKKSSLISCVILAVTSIPCALGYNLWQNIRPIRGMDILGSEDFIVSNVLLPVGALIFLLFCVTRYGWGFDEFRKESNKGKGIKVPEWTKYYFRFVLPLLILVILVQGLL